MGISGVGLAVAARILADAGDVARFVDRNRFASRTGTAPLDASSGQQIRYRLSRARNRRMNDVVHVAAIVQIRHDIEGRAYCRRKLAAGKTPMDASSSPMPKAQPRNPGGHWAPQAELLARGEVLRPVEAVVDSDHDVRHVDAAVGDQPGETGSGRLCAPIALPSPAPHRGVTGWSGGSLSSR